LRILCNYLYIAELETRSYLSAAYSMGPSSFTSTQRAPEKLYR